MKTFDEQMQEYDAGIASVDERLASLRISHRQLVKDIVQLEAQRSQLVESRRAYWRVFQDPIPA